MTFPRPSPNLRARGVRAFTLLEVMIAIVIFCTASFAILALVSQSVDNARRLQKPMIDSGMLAAQFSATNKIYEETVSGNLGDILGDAYRDYTWERNAIEYDSNRLFMVDFKIYGPGRDKPLISDMTNLFYRPESPPGHLDGGGMPGR